MEKINNHIAQYMNKIKNYKYKISVADYEEAYYDAGIDLDKYGYDWSCGFDEFYSNWYADYWWDGFIYIDDIEELIYSDLTEKDKKIICNFLKKIILKNK